MLSSEARWSQSNFVEDQIEAMIFLIKYMLD